MGSQMSGRIYADEEVRLSELKELITIGDKLSCNETQRKFWPRKNDLSSQDLELKERTVSRTP